MQKMTKILQRSPRRGFCLKSGQKRFETGWILGAAYATMIAVSSDKQSMPEAGRKEAKNEMSELSNRAVAGRKVLRRMRDARQYTADVSARVSGSAVRTAAVSAAGAVRDAPAADPAEKKPQGFVDHDHRAGLSGGDRRRGCADRLSPRPYQCLPRLCDHALPPALRSPRHCRLSNRVEH